MRTNTSKAAHCVIFQSFVKYNIFIMWITSTGSNAAFWFWIMNPLKHLCTKDVFALHGLETTFSPLRETGSTVFVHWNLNFVALLPGHCELHSSALPCSSAIRFLPWNLLTMYWLSWNHELNYIFLSLKTKEKVVFSLNLEANLREFDMNLIVWVISFS